MRIPTDMTNDELREAHHAADTLLTDKYRPYLPGRLLPMLLSRFRDELAEALGMELPPLPQRPPARPAKLADLTSSELHEVSGAVLDLVTRFAACMDDPALAPALRDLRDALVIEKADRARIADELRDKARARAS
jgi:hypothetical protein